jgi:hypothetical protein
MGISKFSAFDFMMSDGRFTLVYQGIREVFRDLKPYIKKNSFVLLLFLIKTHFGKLFTC